MVRIHTSLMPKNREDRELLERVHHSIGIAEAMNGCLWLGDKNHKTIYINPVYEKLSGYTLAEAIGRPADFCFDEKSKKTIAEQHKLRAKGTASQYEATMISKTGKKIPLLISGAPTVTGGTIGIFLDISNIKKLQRQEKIWQLIIKHANEAFVVLDKKRKIKLWNTGAGRIFGYKEDEVLNKSVDILIPEEAREANEEMIREVEKKGHVKNIESKRRHKSGELLDLAISVSKVVDNKKNFIGFLVIYRDITQEKKIHTELQRRFETIQDAYKELGLQRRHLDYLYEILDSAVSDSSLEVVEKLIVSAMSLLTKADVSILRIFDKEKKILKLASCFGTDEKWLNKNQIQFDNSIAKEAFENKRAQIIDNVDSYNKHQGKKLLKAHKLKTMILIPLFVQNEFLGSLSLYSENPAKFRLIETDFLENMGKQCSLALFTKIKCSTV